MITEERVILPHLSPEATHLGDITGATIISDAIISNATTFGVTTLDITTSGSTISDSTTLGTIVLDAIITGIVDIDRINISLMAYQSSGRLRPYWLERR